MAAPGAPVIIPKSIFVNQADTFISSHIAKTLLTAVFGFKKSKGKEEEEEEIDEDGGKLKPPEVLTWASTKPLPNDDSEAPFTDEDYRRRLAHPNYLAHLAAEKEIKRLGNTNKFKFLTYIIASGVTYGEEEDIFHPFFKSGWLNAPLLEVFGPGENIIPTIHVRDLASIVVQIADKCPTTHYILATENSRNTLKEIVRAISSALTTGKVKQVPVENAFLSDEITQVAFDHLTVNLSLESVFAHDNFHFKWACDGGFVESIKTMIKEFKLARGLIPIRMCILGPPMSGKSTLASKLSEIYGLPHIRLKDVIDETIAELERKVASSKEEGGIPESMAEKHEDEDEAAEEEEEEDPAEQLEEIKESLQEHKGRLTNDILCKFLKKKLNSKPCQNQGFILDGFPKTKSQAVALFSAGDDEEEEEEAEEEGGEEGGGGGEAAKKDEPPPEEVTAQLEEARAEREREMPDLSSEPLTLMPFPLPTQLPKNILPDCVIFLQATDRFLLDRTLRLPEEEVVGTHNNEEGFLRRLVLFRAHHAGSEVAAVLADEELKQTLSPIQMQRLIVASPSSGEVGNPVQQLVSLMAGSLDAGSVQAFFEDKKVPLLTFDIMSEASKEFPGATRKVNIAMGGPRNYGPSAAERAEVQMQKEALRRAREAAEKELERARIREEERVRDIRTRELASMLEKVKRDEESALLAASQPLRAYLQQYIMPTLCSGILECVKQRPEDPLDYLAEYLFRNNPQVD
ncbi:Adenylate kinase 7 [Sparganum proliferum]